MKAKEKPEKRRGEGQRKPLSTACFPAKQEGTSASVWDSTPPLRAWEKTRHAAKVECYSNRCGRLRTEKMGNREAHSNGYSAERKSQRAERRRVQTVSLKVSSGDDGIAGEKARWNSAGLHAAGGPNHASPPSLTVFHSWLRPRYTPYP